MSKGIKFKNNTYLDSSGVTHNRVSLKSIIDNYITDSGWLYPTMINGWVNRPENASPIRYRKIGKVVYISGAIKSGTFGQQVFTLPVGYRPAGSYICSIVRAGSGIAMFHINFGASGNGVVVIVSNEKISSRIKNHSLGIA
jgi:hypothetical protein